jgi:UDP-N-acetylglucosamine diphosphorylase/glucosamine-1-phosphate N-acetyltransferase
VKPNNNAFDAQLPEKYVIIINMEKSAIYIYEDEGYRNLLPLTWLRPVYELRCGILTLKDKIINQFPKNNVCFSCRSYLEETLKENTINKNIETDEILFINGRILADIDLPKKLNSKDETIFINEENQIVGAKLTAQTLKLINFPFPLDFNKLSNLKKTKINAKLINYPWDLIHNNAGELEKDFKLLVKKKIKKAGHLLGVFLINTSQIHIGKGVKISPACVIDAENGPVYIDDGVKILPHATIIGPVYIGKDSTIKAGAKIYGPTSIGPVCKIGGEVEGSIIHGYSNKQHDGFLGHSYIGEWANLGAGTENSDLKNNYGNIKIYVDGKFIDSGQTFMGAVIGDHSKTGINTMLNTGTVIGVFTNVFGAGFPPKFIPSFSWGGKEKLENYDFDKAIEVAKKVMSRRGIALNSAHIKLFQKVFQETSSERYNAR